MVPNPANTPTFARFALGSSLILCNKVHIVSMKYMVGLLYYIWPSAISIVVGKLQDAACVVVANGGDHLLFHLLWSTWEAPFSHPARLSLALRVYFWRKLGSGTVGRWWWWGWDMITYIVWWYTIHRVNIWLLPYTPQKYILWHNLGTHDIMRKIHEVFMREVLVTLLRIYIMHRAISII